MNSLRIFFLNFLGKVFLFVLLLSSQPTHARLKTDFGLDSTFQYFDFYNANKKNDVRYNHLQWDLKPHLQIHSKDTFFFEAKPLITGKTQTQSSSEKLFVDPQVTKLTYVHKKIHLTVGSNIYNWGRLDGYSPLDVIHQRAYFNPFSPIKLGVMGLDIKYDSLNFQSELLYIPKRLEKTRLPAKESPWLPRSFLIHTDYADKIEVPENIGYYELEDRIYHHALENNLGFKNTFHYGPIDFSLIYYRGVNTNPQIQPSLSINTVESDPSDFTRIIYGIASSDIGLRQSFFPMETSGFSAVYANDLFILRWESAYTSYKIKDITALESSDSWLFQNGVSFEKQFFFDQFTLTQVMNYYYSNFSNRKDNLAGSFKLFADSALLSFIFSDNEQNSIALSGLWDTPSKSSLTNLQVNYRFFENSNEFVKITILNGPNDSLIGTYKDMDSVEVGFQYFF